MTDKRVVWERPDGSIAVTIPAPKGRRPGESEGRWIKRVAAKAQAAASGLADATRLPDCLADDLPRRYFRNCWRNDGAGAVQVDMPLAREQRMMEIRAERDTKLPELDVEWSRASAKGDQAEADRIEAKRQALRDLPAGIDLEGILLAEDLEAFQPPWPELS